jgi:O-acetyl-ADP-ribose deacetylase (regulator of RNase III)
VITRLARSGRVAAGEQQILESFYFSCLEIAFSQRFRDIAFPAIATGDYGFAGAAAPVTVTTIGSYLTGQQLPKLVIFSLLRRANFERLPRCGWLWSERMSCGQMPALVETFAF